MCLGALPGPVQPLDPAGRSVLWTLDGHVGLGALTFTRAGRSFSLPLRVRARWDEPTALVTGMIREVCAARWSAAVRDDAGALTVPAGLDDAARDPDAARVVLALLAEDPGAARRARRRAPRALDHAARGGGRDARRRSRASSLLAARGEDADTAMARAAGVRAPAPSCCRSTPTRTARSGRCSTG
ncbi:MAG: hypothetical protein U0325_28530 [Polyangiales bacterium]